MDKYEVETRNGFAAAIQAAAQPTRELALAFPFSVELAGTNMVYKAPYGVTTRQAEKTAKNIKNVGKRSFERVTK